MAEVRAFRGWRYEPAVAGDGEALLAPPYDIIGPDQERALRDRSDFNIVHVELPEGPTETDAPDNRYARAAARFGEWRERGVLRREDAPALYVYAQEFALASGERHRRLGSDEASRLPRMKRVCHRARLQGAPFRHRQADAGTCPVSEEILWVRALSGVRPQNPARRRHHPRGGTEP